MAAKKNLGRKKSSVQNVGLVFRLRIKWIAKVCLFSISAIPGSDQTGFTKRVNWFCVYGKAKEVAETSLFEVFLSVFYFLNNHVPFLTGKEILCNRFSLNWIFTSTSKLPQLVELSLSDYQHRFPYLLFSGSDWFSGYFFSSHFHVTFTQLAFLSILSAVGVSTYQSDKCFSPEISVASPNITPFACLLQEVGLKILGRF